MKILIANYRYFVSGGPERYMFNVIGALTDRGHDVIPFSIRYSQNHPTPYDRYFVSPLAGDDQVFFRDQPFTPGVVLKTLSRLFYAPDVEAAVKRLAEDTRPDVAYVLHYFRKLSPAVLVGLKKAGLPIVARLSDYAMLCPATSCSRDGHPCELCVRGDISASIRYRCVKGSLPISAVNAAATWYHRRRRYFDSVDYFVTTTRFMYDMMLSAGYAPERLVHIPTFVDSDFFHPSDQREVEGDPYFVYVGRLDYDKGVHILLDAWQRLKKGNKGRGFQLKIAGAASGDEGYAESLKAKDVPDVAFLGELSKQAIADLVRNAYMAIVPSVCYDNLPNSVLESYASGVPVIASQIGSFKECVVENETGLLFEVGNSDELAQRMEAAIDHPGRVASMSLNARRAALDEYSPEKHLASLESLFVKATGKNQ
jgi:glycosyltransferase involved in cell wall biosynthesis